jgi:HlyD family secretion protein
MSETSSLVNESKSKRKKYIRGVIAITLIGGGLLYWWLQSRETEEEGPEIENYTVERLDIRELVESEGSIINPDIANLSFLINGTLGDLSVEEGQKVAVGETLAKLDTTDLLFDLRDAQNGVNIAFANIEATRANLTDTEVLSSNQDVAKANEDFAAAERTAEQRVDQAFDDLSITMAGIFPEIEQVLQEVDNVLGEEKLNTGEILIVSVFNDRVRESRVKNQYRQARLKLNTLRDEYQGIRNNNEALQSFVVKLRTLLNETKVITDEMAALLKSAQPSGFVSSSQIEAARNDNASNNNVLVAEVNSLNNANQAIQSARLGRQNDLNSARKNLEGILVRQENSQRNQARLEINKSTGLDIQFAQLAQSRLRVDKANYNLSLATLKTPIDGIVVEVNGNVGETIKVETANSDNAFIKVLSDSNFTTEVLVEENDIAQIQIDQMVEITLDAIQDVTLKGKVNFISSTATRDNNGIVSYLVRIEIADDQGAAIREGMTTQVSFIMGEALAVLAIPNDALVDETFVILEDGRKQEIEIGFSDGNLTEVKSGLSEEQIILIGAEEGTTSGNREAAGEDIEARMEAIGERLEASGTKPAGWDRMSVKEKQDALQDLRGGQGGFGGAPSSGSGRPSGGGRP